MFKKVKSIMRKIIPKNLQFTISNMLFEGKMFVLEGATYNQDGLVTRHNSDFMQEKRFKNSYDLAVRLGLEVDAKIHWRAHVACWAASIGSKLEGDFVECGVNKGFLSRIVMEYIGFKELNKTFYLMDTFEGFSEKYLTEKEKITLKNIGTPKDGKIPWYWGPYRPCYDEVKKTFSSFSNVKIIKGPIPETLPQANPKKVAYLSIDMNVVIPEVAAAEYFWDKMVPGAIILLDDYGWKGHDSQKIGFDKFAKERDVKILSLPTGQGIIIKQ